MILLAAALAAATPPPVRAEDRRHTNLLKVLLLLKGAPQMRAMAERQDKARRSHAPVKPARPAVSHPGDTELLAARSDSGSDPLVLPMAKDLSD